MKTLHFIVGQMSGRFRTVAAVCLALGLGLFSAGPIQAATRTWAGAASNPFWNNVTNWSGFAAPANGDDVFFPVNAGNKSSLNNLGVTNYDTIFLAGSNYAFSGATIPLSGGIVATNRGGTNTFAAPVVLRADQTFSHDSGFSTFGNPTLQFASVLDLNGHDLTWDADGFLRVLGPIVGNGNITLNAALEEALFASASTFTGLVNVVIMDLRLGSPLALGSTNGGVLANGGTLILNPGVSITNELVEFSTGGFQADGGTGTWAGPVTNGAGFLASFDAPTASSLLRISGPISGSSGYIMSGPGTISYFGGVTNTYTGFNRLLNGVTFLLEKPAGVTASSSRIEAFEASTIRLGASEQIANNRGVSLADNSLFDLNGFTETIAFLGGVSNLPPGRVSLGSSGTNQLIVNSSTTTNFAGSFTGSGGVVKLGSSTWTLQGTNSATGTTIVGNGTLIVDGRFNTSPLLVTNGTLGGTGTLASVTLSNATATLNPGPTNNFVGRLIITNDLSLLGGTLQLEVSGTVPGILRDDLRVGGTTRITNSALQIELNFVPAPGTSIPIIDNTGSSAVLGQFNGLPEGAVINAVGQLLRISYLGGTGNDVTLTKVTNIATGVTRTWNGAGANNFWFNGANWVGSTRPQGGDSLYFPPGAARVINTNDFPPIILNTILLGAGGYDLRGNGITLLGGITSTNSSGTATVRTPITLGADQLFGTANSGGTLNISAPIDALTNDIQFVTQGPIVTAGPITGSGQLTKFGLGELSILGTNTLTKTNFINEGSLFVSGAITGRVVLASGTTLSGLGYVGQIQCASGSTVTAGDLPDPNRLTIGNELRLTNGSFLAVKLNGTTPGISHDQISVTNSSSTVVLSNATLQVDLNFAPVAGNTFTIIDKAGAGGVSGTFSGLPEGAILTVSNVLFRISYVGGTGNDVVLTVLSTGPTGITRAWTGAAFPSTNWSNPTNWSGNLVPSPGDALFFSGTLPDVQKTNVYDLAAGTIFDQLVFGDGQCRYRIFGTTPVFLDNGIMVTNATFGPSFTVPIELFSDQVFSNTGPSGLRVTTVITDGHQLVLDGNGSFTIDGDVSGTGSLVKRGSGPLRFNAAATFTGPLDVQAGSVEVNSTFSLGGAAAGTTVAEGASIVFVSSGHNWGEPLTLAGTMNSGTTTNVAWSGPITLIAPEGVFDVGVGGALRLSAIIGGTGGLTKTGAGTLTLTATNTFTGATLIQSGTLLANGIHTNSPLTVSTNGTLGGTGVVASVAVNGGSIAPGTNNSPGTLSISGGLALNAGSMLALDLDGLSPGSGHDQLLVTGTVSLSGNPPAISLGFTPTLGSTFVIIQNDGADAVNGTFAGIPQGGTFVSGLVNWQVNYAGGDGNDVALTVVPFVPSGATSVWTGAGGPNFFWTNASNWAGNIAPAPGNDLVFPGSGQFNINTNNFPPDVFFNSLRFENGQVSYSLLGNPLALISGITMTNVTSVPLIAMPVRLLADQTFLVVSQTLFISDVILNEHELVVDGSGQLVIGGIIGIPALELITGNGTVRKRGSGILDLQRTNNYTGLTIIEQGTIQLDSNGTLGSPTDGTIVSNGATLLVQTQLRTNAEPLTLGGTLAFRFATTNFWIAPITLASSNATFDIGTNSTLKVTSLISGSGSFVKSNAGTLVLEADNSYSAETRVLGGSLAISNSHLTGPVTLGSNTVLTANGQIGSLTSTGATFGAGTLTVPGLLQLNGGLTFDGGTKFDVDIDGTIAGTSYDQVRVNGPVNLAGAQLSLAITVSAPIGSTFVIIRKDSPGPVTGTFVGLPQNATFTRGAFLWQIDYFGIDGNDVVLRVISQSFPGVVWDGGGSDSNWLTALNWLSDAAPSPGVDLIFSNEADQRTNFNNFATGTSFNSLRFTGLTNFGNSGFTIAGNPLALTTGITADSNAASSQLNFDIALASGATITADSTLSFRGAVSNVGTALNVSGRSSLIFFAPVTAPGLVSSASFIGLNTNNFFNGPILVSTGTVSLGPLTGALGSPTNIVTVESGATLGLVNATNTANPLTLRGALLSSRTNTWSGPIVAQGTNVTFGNGNGPLTIDGAISGSGEMTIAGAQFGGGPVVFNGSNSYSGITRVNTGTLIVNGSHAGSPIHVSTNGFTFFGFTTLSGNGTVGDVFSGGFVSPGLTTNAGILSVAGSITLSNTATLDLQINGSVAGAGYDQLRVAGDVAIQNARLQISQLPAFIPSVGGTFTVIRNDGPNPVNGTFAGLPGGAFITNFAVFQISYAGGDGNDVMLTCTAQKGLIDIWTGNGANSNATTAANWLYPLPPEPGDILVFSNSAVNRVVQNDFPAGTPFRRLRFVGFNSGASFAISGNAMTLTEGIDGFAFSPNTNTLPIIMGAPLTFSNAGSTLIFRGGITNNGNDLTINVGTFDFVGPYVGAGGLIFTNAGFGFSQLNLRTNNPYAGPTVFSGSVSVFVDQPGGLGDTNAGTVIGDFAYVQLTKPMTFAEPITLAGRLDFANGPNVMAAPLTIAGSNVLMCITSPRMEFNGPINGAGRVQLCGIATNFFNGGGAFVGRIDTSTGRQIIAGQYPGMDILIDGTLNFSSSIEGTGRVAAIRGRDQGTNSFVSPGINGPGVLTCNSLIIESNITLRIELNGTAPGAGHDQLLVQGDVALTNCTLELSLGFTPALGDSFTVLNNAGPNAVAGEFLGLPEGSSFVLSNQLFAITYRGGDGNDIVIARGSPPPRFSSITLSNGLVQLQILGQAGNNYVIEATTNLLDPANLTPWIPISTNPAGVNGVFQFIDADTTNFPSRFYRVLSP